MQILKQQFEKMHYNNKNIRHLLQDDQKQIIKDQNSLPTQTLFTYSFPIKLFTQNITSRQHFLSLLNQQYQQHPQYSRSFNLKIKQNKKNKRATITCIQCTAKIQYELNKNQTVWTLKKYKNYHEHTPPVQNCIKNLAKNTIQESLHLNDRQNYLNVLKKYDLKRDYFNRGKNQLLNKCEFRLIKKYLDKLSYHYQYFYQYGQDPYSIGLPDFMIILTPNSKQLYQKYKYLVKYERVETIIQDRSYSRKNLQFGLFYGYNNSLPVHFGLSVCVNQTSRDFEKMFKQFFNLMQNCIPHYFMTEQRIQVLEALQNLKSKQDFKFDHILDPYLYLLNLLNSEKSLELQTKQIMIQKVKCVIKEYSPTKGQQLMNRLQNYCKTINKSQIFNNLNKNKSKLCFWLLPKKFMGSFHIESTSNQITIIKKKLKKSKNTYFMIKKYHDFHQKSKNQKLKLMKMFQSYKFEDLFEDDKLLILRNQLQKYHFLIFMQCFQKSEIYIILKYDSNNSQLSNYQLISDKKTNIVIKNQCDQSIKNIVNWSCQCSLFQRLGVPCEHIIAIYRKLFAFQNYENIIDKRILSQYPGPLIRLNQQRQIHRRFNHRRKCRSRRNHV